MNKLKLFLENFFVYGFGGIISKIIPLIMVPIVTRMMPDSSYYGISDMANTIISLFSALAVMGMYDAMYRMFFEKEDTEYQKDICSTALFFTLGTSIIVSVLMAICKNWIAQLFFDDTEYVNLVYITAIATLVGSTNSIISAPTRMQNKRGTYLIMNTVSPVLSYTVAIPLLLNGYYLMALPVATVVAGTTCELTFWVMNRKWFSLGRFNKKYLKQLLVIAIPLLPNLLIYWIFNSCDKLMITHMMGTGATGVYSVAAKIGSISQLIYTAFAGGWQFFAFSTMREQDQVKSNSKIFEYLGIISFGVTVFMFALSRSIFQLFFEEEYLSGYLSAPYLFLAPLLQMLFQVAANQFLVVKKTWPNLLILSGGAVVNIVLNLVLIPVLGIEGASIASLAGYVIANIVCCIVLTKMKLMVMSKRFILSCVIMSAYIVVWRLFLTEIIWLALVLALVVAAVFVLLYLKDIKKLFKELKNAFKKTKNE